MDKWKKALEASRELDKINQSKNKKNQKKQHDYLIACLLEILRDTLNDEWFYHPPGPGSVSSSESDTGRGNLLPQTIQRLQTRLHAMH